MVVTARNALHYEPVKPSVAVLERLRAANVTAHELAGATGLTRGMAKLILRGRRGLSAKHYPATAALLGLSTHEAVRPLSEDAEPHDRAEDERELVRLYRSTHQSGKQLILGFVRMIVAQGLRQMSGEVIEEPPDHPTATDRQGQIAVGDLPSFGAQPGAARRRKRAGRKRNQ